MRFRDAEGNLVAAIERPGDYQQYIGEAVVPHSYLKAPYFKPLGYPQGIYRVGPLARLNVADRCGTPEADAELEQFRQRFGRVPHSAFLYHYARLIEALYALERMEALLNDPEILELARARFRRRELARRRGHRRGAARGADPSLQGGREGRHDAGPT